MLEKITQIQILNAINAIDDNSKLRIGRESSDYDLIHNNKKYPPILVLSEANKLAGGKKLTLENFNNSAKSAFKILKKLGFKIEAKSIDQMDYFKEIKEFLSQANTNNLKTKNYRKTILNLKIKVSFGQGYSAKVPWIAFLDEYNSVQDGIYPVYLYYKEKGILILAYGVSETRRPKQSWKISNPITINDYFEDNNLGVPQRYGTSFIYKVYSTKHKLNETNIESDLKSLLVIYKSIKKPKSPQMLEIFKVADFEKDLKNSGLLFSNNLLVRFIASLLTKPFVILTGLTGSGKTKLAQAFVQWICQDESQYRIIPVGADWTNREPLLGYPNALKVEEYVKPDSGVLELIIQANHNPDLPYFLILDEMNLSHVERYFADFLSVMESKEGIPLFTDGTVDNGVPSKLNVPSNLFITGTVNIDETTNMFSPKVLDRANTIEFRVTENEMRAFLRNIKEINMEALKSNGAGMAKSFLQMADNKSFAATISEEINKTLVSFFGQLKKSGAEFGYRSATEILKLINQLTALDSHLTTNEKVDIAIIQKLLPKLHGSRRKLCPVFETLGAFCISGEIKIVKEVFEKEDFDFNSSNVLYPLSLEKIARMYKCAIENGFASFAEA